MTVELKLVALVVVGMLVSWRGPYVDLHVVSEKANETTPAGIIDWEQPIAIIANVAMKGYVDLSGLQRSYFPRDADVRAICSCIPAPHASQQPDL
jgi:hypothetical protein